MSLKILNKVKQESSTPFGMATFLLGKISTIVYTQYSRDHKLYSLHYFHGYTIKDREDLKLSDAKRPQQKLNPEEQLPSISDV